MLNGPEQKASSGKTKSLFIFLHGLGADGNDLFSLVPHFAKHFPDAHFISPHAPFPCDMAPFGKQWFSLQERSEEAILKGVREAEPVLNEFINKKIEDLDIKDENVFLVGFSQGTMLSLHTSVRREKPLGGVLGFSGALVAPQLLETELKSKPPMCLIHGEADEVVPFDAFNVAVPNLQKHGVPVSSYSRQGLGHGIDPAGLEIGIQFLKDL